MIWACWEYRPAPDRVRVPSDTWFRKYLGACALFPSSAPRGPSRRNMRPERQREKGAPVRSLPLSQPTPGHTILRPPVALSCAQLDSPLPPSPLLPPPSPRRTAGAGGKRRRRPRGHQTRAWRTTEDDAQLRRELRG